MSIQRKSNNKRLLDALDHIDGRYVAELVEGLRLPKESAAAPAAKRSIRTSLKYAALIAACALILGAAIPVAGSLIRNLTSGMAAAGDPARSESNESSALIESEMPESEQQKPNTVDEMMIEYGWSPKSITKEEVDEIVKAYLKYDTAPDKYDYTYSVRCYAKYHHSSSIKKPVYAVMIDSDRWNYTQGERTEKVYYGSEKNSYLSFIFPSDQPMLVYCDGNFYTLNEAMEQSVLEFRELMQIRWSDRVGGSFSSCGYPIYLTYDELCTVALSNPQIGTGSFDYRCYGKFEGAYVIFADKTHMNYEPKQSIETVGGFTFVYPNENKMQVCANGTFISLAEAYEKKILTDVDLAEVYDIYTKSDEIKYAFLKKYEDKMPDMVAEDKELIVKFQGIYDDVYVAVVAARCFNMTKRPTETVNGLTFTWMMQYDIHVYNKGELYTLTEAFERSMITADQLSEVHESYHKDFGEMYGPRSVTD